ncbi:MAG TPA: UDP-N-acetyl glucosamine 2-epimerase, partial [Gammaproteobacteria bacterium]|nr:UDP-N-acetyl glucosamine 2-epimerase [Gammaproteobacteria bacterium]
ENLRSEGVPDSKIFFVGNVMIDTLLKHREMAAELDLMDRYQLTAGAYAMLTLHRPSNVDEPEVLERVLQTLQKISRSLPIVFPIHPRTRKMVDSFGFSHYLDSSDDGQFILTEPLGYLEFLHLNMNAKMVLTDSGGLQEETTVLGVPCITMRENTERPITCEIGTNVIVGNSADKILQAANDVLEQNSRPGQVPEYWDGRAAERIVSILIDEAGKTST